MKDTSSIQKTFMICTQSGDSVLYFRLRSYQTDRGQILYTPTFTRNVTDASRYMALETAKEKAKILRERLGLKSVEVVDEQSKRRYPIH